MNRLGTALLAAIEAVVTVGVGIGIALVPLTLLWGFEYGLQVDWDVFWKATGSVWLVGHGVDVSFLLGSALAKSTGVSGAADPIHVTLAALGFAVVTAWLGARAGRRFAETEHRTTGLLIGTAVVALLGLAVALSSTSTATHPTFWQAVVLPALWFGIPALAASEVCRRRRDLPADAGTQRVIDLVDRIPAVWRSVAGFGLRAGTAATAVVVGVAAVLVGLLLFTSFAEVITLYEQSHAGVIGGVALTVGQLAFLPDFVGWATSWLIGPGFAIGTGSSVSPIATTLGPIPGLPVFGALPTSGHTFGLVWVLVPVIAGFAIGGSMRPRLVRALGAADSALHRALGGVVAGLVAGVLTGLIAWVSSGSFGPGRLADVGPNALAVGGFAALEVGLPAIIALAAGSDLVRLPDHGWTRERWTEADEADDDHDTARAGVDLGEGSLLAALDQAGAGRTTDVHRFVVEESHDGSTAARPRGTTEHATEPGSSEPIRSEPADAPPARPTSAPARPASAPVAPRAGDTDHDVELPDWAKTDAVAADRLAAEPGPERRSAGRAALDGLRDRLAGAAEGVRGRAGALRDRVTGSDAEPQRPGTERPAAPAPAAAPTPVPTDAQPAFPWSTEEFVAGRDDVDETAEADRVDVAPDTRAPTSRPAEQSRPTKWDVTDQIPEDELPWWRQPKDDR
ncbi:cell division protein PerM [Curtobacterium flaccumfaciens]|uniref:cell division protein PerM n=1 Tax=Curtobacterium flaccumfaciens TaxID=2035 RepID=UPI003879A114